MPPRAEEYLPLTPLAFNLLMALAREARHGYGIIKSIEEHTGGRMRPATGTVYLALQRLVEDGLLEETGSPDDADARRRYYRLTAFGRAVMKAEARRLAADLETAESLGIL